MKLLPLPWPYSSMRTPTLVFEGVQFAGVLWAYAERCGIPEILSEDFQHARRYGSVRAVNPFLDR